MKKVTYLALAFTAILSLASCSDDDDANTTPTQPSITVPDSLTVTQEGFYPEDIVISDNIVYLSGFGDSTIRTIDLSASNLTDQLFVAGEADFAQRWGLKVDGDILLSLLGNADFTGGAPGPSKLVTYNKNTGAKLNEWTLPDTTIGHTVSVVDGKYYVTDFGNPRIIEVNPQTGAINESWFTSSDWDPTIDGNVGGTIYDGQGGFYAYLGFNFWYIPISNGQPRTMQQVTINGLSGEQINADGISFDSDTNTLYYSSNDTGNPQNVGTVYKLQFSNTTTATGSIIAEGLNDASGVWLLKNEGVDYLFMCESQFGALFGFNTFQPPFVIRIQQL